MTSRGDVIVANAKAELRAELKAEMDAVRAAQAAVVRELEAVKVQRDTAIAESDRLRASMAPLQQEVARWKQEAEATAAALQAAKNAAAQQEQMANMRTSKWGTRLRRRR